MIRDDPRHNLRLPPTLKTRLAHSAIDNSMNAEILSRLERSFEADPAQQIAQSLQAMLGLNDTDRARLIELLVEASKLIAQGRNTVVHGGPKK